MKSKALLTAMVLVTTYVTSTMLAVCGFPALSCMVLIASTILAFRIQTGRWI